MNEAPDAETEHRLLPVAPPTDDSEPRPTQTMSRRLGLTISAAWLLAGITAAWLATSGSWLATKVGSSAADRVYRGDIMSRDPSSYEQGLLNWPYLAAISLGVAAITLAIALLVTRNPNGPSRTTVLSAWALAGYASFLATLVGVRWFGFVLARAMDPGPTWLYPGTAPIGLLGLGVVGLGSSVFLYRHLAPTPLKVHASVRRLTGWLATTAAATLLLLALVPLAKSNQTEVYRYDELTMAALLDAAQNPAQPVAQAFFWAHVALWSMLAGALLVWAILRDVPAATPPGWKRVTALGALALLLPVTGLVVATIQFYLRIAEMSDIMSPTLAYILPISAFGMLFLCLGIVNRLVRGRARFARVIDPENTS